MWCGLFALLPMKKDNKKEINQYLIKRTRIIWFFLLCAFNFLGGKLLVELLRLQIKRVEVGKTTTSINLGIGYPERASVSALWIQIRRETQHKDQGMIRMILIARLQQLWIKLQTKILIFHKILAYCIMQKYLFQLYSKSGFGRGGSSSGNEYLPI